MGRILSLLLSAHWTMVFATLSVLSVVGRNAGFPLSLRAMGVAPSGGLSGFLAGTAGALALAFGFGVVAILFVWTFLTLIFEDGPGQGEGDVVARMAFCGAVGILTAIFVACALAEVRGLYQMLGFELTALLASYVALAAERSAAERMVGRDKDDVATTARTMALGAAHISLVARILNRSSLVEGR